MGIFLEVERSALIGRTISLSPKVAADYLILCITFDRGTTGPFELTIESSRTLGLTQSSEKYFARKSTRHILGNWNKTQAGGCSSEPSFALNPQYRLSLASSPDAEICLELTSQDQYPVGIAVLEAGSGCGPVYECDAAEVSEMVSNSSFLVEVNTLTVKIKKGTNYIVIVSTYAAGQVCLSFSHGPCSWDTSTSRSARTSRSTWRKSR